MSIEVQDFLWYAPLDVIPQVCLGNCSPPDEYPLITQTGQIPKKKENKMRTETYVSAPITIEGASQTDEGRDHILSRISGIFYERKDELEDEFLKEIRPTTYGEAREWIKKGKFRLFTDETRKDDASFCHFDYNFSWGTKEPDKEGFYKAYGKLKTAKLAATDIVMVKTDEDTRLKALKDFESAKFH